MVGNGLKWLCSESVRADLPAVDCLTTVGVTTLTKHAAVTPLPSAVTCCRRKQFATAEATKSRDDREVTRRDAFP